MNNLLNKSGFSHQNAWPEHIRKLHQTRPDKQFCTPVTAVKEQKQGFSQHPRWGNAASEKV